MRRSIVGVVVFAALGCTEGRAPAPSVPAAPSTPAGPAVFLRAPLPASPRFGGGGVREVGPESAPVVEGERTPLGATPRAVAESEVALDRSSPAATVAALVAALDRKDEPALARLHSLGAGKAVLDEQDLLRARIDFLGGREAHWRRVLQALDRDALSALDASAERAVLRVEVGGALGAVDLVFVKEGGAWAVGL